MSENVNQGIALRPAGPEDAADLLEIYRPYVEETAISFEREVPTLADFRSRISRISDRYPYYLAECSGKILGYAYAAPFIRRAAYDHSVEMSIYLDETATGRGLGRFHRSGYKFGRWYDMVWMEKMIGDHRKAQERIIPWKSPGGNPAGL